MLVTFYPPLSTKSTQKDFEQLLFQNWDDIALTDKKAPIHRLLTVDASDNYIEKTFQKYMTHPNYAFNGGVLDPLSPPRELNCHLASITLPTDTSYKSFKIPKRSDPRKFRQIDEPNQELKTYLRNVKEMIENQMMFIPHDCAHAYVKNRNVVTAMKQHQNNQSRWFLKLDLRDFFPSHDKQFIFQQMRKVYPFGVLLKHPNNGLSEAIDKALYKGGLPQGTPLSPLLSNITMVPIDHAIHQNLKASRNHYVYTRYADDMIISCKVKFNPDVIITMIQNVLNANNAPFRINNEKTRFGSSNGRNWNLGIMYNKDLELTAGHKNNQKLRAAVFQFYMDNSTPGKHWGIMETQKLIGLIAWYQSIQPERTDAIIAKYENKFNRSFKSLAAEILNPIN